MCKLQQYKSLLIGSLLLLANIICHAQNLLQTPDVMCKGNVPYSTVGYYNKSWIIAFNENEIFTIRKYNAAMAEWSKVEIPSIPYNIDQLFFCKQKNGFTAMYLLENGKRLQWYALEVDTNFLMVKEPHLLTQTTHNANAEIQLTISENNEHFALYRMVANPENDSTEIQYFVYSNQHPFAEWQTLNVGETYKTEYNAKIFVWNNGQVNVVCNTLQKSTSMLTASQLFTVAKNNVALVKKLDLRKQECNYQMVNQNEQTKTLHFCFTHAAEDRREDNVIITTTYQLLQDSLSESNIVVVPKLTNKKTKVEAFTNYLPRNWVQKTDGSSIIIFEYFDMQEMILGADISNNPASQFRVSRLIKKYEYGDILMVNLKGDSIVKVSTIHKEQTSENDSGVFSSFALIKLKSVLGVAFNSLDANKTIQFASIGIDNDATYKIMSGNSIDVTNLLFKKAKQISSTELIVPCEKQNSVSFVKIVF